MDQSVLEDLLAAVVKLTDDTGRLLSPPFRLLPRKDVSRERTGEFMFQEGFI